jgi:hypothetical protein
MGVSSSAEHLKGRSAADCSKILYPSSRLHGVKMHKGASDLKIETLCMFEMLVSMCQAAWYCIIMVIDGQEFRRQQTPQQKGMWTEVRDFRKYCVYMKCYTTVTAGTQQLLPSAAEE